MHGIYRLRHLPSKTSTYKLQSAKVLSHESLIRDLFRELTLLHNAP